MKTSNYKISTGEVTVKPCGICVARGLEMVTNACSVLP